ncbi:MAG: hypothetical protein A2X86_13650 [Bdellovibrionales bacterium GWA2_49_15]|nr:MAG: hypothetical protein A2X86_13650 [Bdellovibrionales bacterium GWA2_49_15]HAZ13571.1 hypothetical protein [Bdellovibrionales bacterium]
MRTFKLTTTVLLLSFTFSVAQAANRLYCTWSSSANGCLYKDMQLYNQRLVSDMHCGPTSAAMGLSALTYGGISYYTGSSTSPSDPYWTYNKFVYKSEIDRIKNFGILMNTSSTSGTSGSNIKKFQERERDFPGASGHVNNAGDYTINNTFVRSKVWDSEVQILTYGHYKEVCSNVLGAKLCNYNRDGGHVIALNGYYYDAANGVNVTTFDPWGAVVKNRTLTYLSNLSTLEILGIRLDGRTYGGRTHYVYRSDDRVKIIDHTNGIQSR